MNLKFFPIRTQADPNPTALGTLKVTEVDTSTLGYVTEMEVLNFNYPSYPNKDDNFLDYYREQYRKKLLLYWLLEMKPHDFFYDRDEDGEAEWQSTLWNRLGFSYSGIGKISQHTEKFESYDSQLSNLVKTNPFYGLNQGGVVEEYAAPGLISHNAGDLSIVTSISGLGNQQKANDEGNEPIETFDTVGYFQGFTPLRNVDAPVPGADFLPTFATDPTDSIQITDLPTQYESIYLIRDAKPLKADRLPVLSSSNYFLVESDIISNNYLDPIGSKGTVIGIVDKQNSSSDTIYSTEGIDFTIKQPTILSRFTIRVTNPDGSDVSDDILKQSSGFIFIIERAVNPVLPKPPA